MIEESERVVQASNAKALEICPRSHPAVCLLIVTES